MNYVMGNQAMCEENRNDIEKKIDILEEDIVEIDPAILALLLQDKTTKKNILWCTTDYESYGSSFHEKEEIKVDLITGDFARVIQPRAAKAKEIQEKRIKKRAEVFTPSWICNEQNNQIDEAWFGRAHVFNTPHGTGWVTNKEKIMFNHPKKDWKSYVNSKRLEITCGEAPYLVSRYDTTTGELIPIQERIGLFDRKMRIVEENCEDDDTWLDWSVRALKSTYGYEFQGDSLLIARESLLYDYIDYYQLHFGKEPPISWLKKIANIIAYNLWQMDGLRGVVPYSCEKEEIPIKQTTLFGPDEEAVRKCPGCTEHNIHKHIGTYCRIFDWTNLKKTIPFIDVL